jgi:hypothetical protein
MERTCSGYVEGIYGEGGGVVYLVREVVLVGEVRA